MRGLKFDHEVYLTDHEIEKQYVASGIDMNSISYTELIETARQFAPRVHDKVTNTCQIRIFPKGTDEYYENIYFAAKGKNRKLMNLFMNTGFQMSWDQKFEIRQLCMCI